jgi:hypothetical protein
MPTIIETRGQQMFPILDARETKLGTPKPAVFALEAARFTPAGRSSDRPV